MTEAKGLLLGDYEMFLLERLQEGHERIRVIHREHTLPLYPRLPIDLKRYFPEDQSHDRWRFAWLRLERILIPVVRDVIAMQQELVGMVMHRIQVMPDIEPLRQMPWHMTIDESTVDRLKIALFNAQFTGNRPNWFTLFHDNGQVRFSYGYQPAFIIEDQYSIRLLEHEAADARR